LYARIVTIRTTTVAARATSRARNAATRHTSRGPHPDAQLYRKGKTASELRYMGHTLTDNRHGLVVNARVTRADGHAERAAARIMRPRRNAGGRGSGRGSHAGCGQGLRRTGIHRGLPADEGHTARCAKHLGAAFGSARYARIERGLSHFAAKAQVDRTGLRVGEDRRAYAPGDGARVEESGPDVRVEHGRLQPRAPAFIGTGPPVVAKNAAMRPEIGLTPPNKRGIHV
jgi:hypothetical protein